MANAGDVKTIQGEKGNYTVETLENGYTITKEGEIASMDLIFDVETQTWSVASEGESTELLKMNEDGTADLYLQDGSTLNVTLDEQGTLAARQVVAGSFFAAR